MKDQNKDRYGSNAIIIKTVIMLLIYFVPLSIVSFSGISNTVYVYMLFIISGLGMAGIGMGIMHDALHGSYSGSKVLNKIMGYTMNIIGASDTVWKLQHNVLHHSFTNIEHHDDDINAPFFLRFSPHSRKNALHKYQHFYVWFFYGLSTMSWITAKDFIRLTRYRKMGLIKSSREFNSALVKIIVWKLLYYSYMLLLPLILSPVASVHIILAFLAMHFVTGLTISLVFQTAHVMPDNEYPLPDDAGRLTSERLVHQLQTTCNFSPKNRMFSWLIGGLNFQIEHHLFPHISHVHYRNIAPIVKRTTEEFGIPYHSYSSFGVALKSHYLMLRKLGSMPST